MFHARKTGKKYGMRKGRLGDRPHLCSGIVIVVFSKGAVKNEKNTFQLWNRRGVEPLLPGEAMMPSRSTMRSAESISEITDRMVVINQLGGC